MTTPQPHVMGYQFTASLLKTRKVPGALYPTTVLPPLMVQNILQTLEIRALACVVKGVTKMFV